MKPFTVFDVRTGKIIRSGTCQDHMIDAQARQGERSIELKVDSSHHAVDLVTMAPISKPVEPIVIDPLLQRHRAYPSAGEQLGVIWKQIQHWHDSASLPLLAETADMLDRINAVKKEFPKP